MNNKFLVILGAAAFLVIGYFFGTMFDVTKKTSNSNTVTNTNIASTASLLLTTPANSDESEFTSQALGYHIILPNGFSAHFGQPGSSAVSQVSFSSYDGTTHHQFTMDIYNRPNWMISDVTSATQWSAINRPTTIESAEAKNFAGHETLVAIEPDTGTSKNTAYYMFGNNYLYVISTFDFPSETMQSYLERFVTD